MHVGQEIVALLARQMIEGWNRLLQQIHSSRCTAPVYRINDQHHVVPIEQLLNQAHSADADLDDPDTGGQVAALPQAAHDFDAESIVASQQIPHTRDKYASDSIPLDRYACFPHGTIHHRSTIAGSTFMECKDARMLRRRGNKWLSLASLRYVVRSPRQAPSTGPTERGLPFDTRTIRRTNDSITTW